MPPLLLTQLQRLLLAFEGGSEAPKAQANVFLAFGRLLQTSLLAEVEAAAVAVALCFIGQDMPTSCTHAACSVVPCTPR